MKITKLIHACLLVEDQGKIVLIDPGDFSWRDQGFKDFISNLERLDYVVYTHSHYDHLSEDAALFIANRFSNVKFLGDQESASKLKAAGIDCSTDSNEYIELIKSSHEQFFPGTVMCEHVHVKLFGRLVHTGDSMSDIKETEILALPIYGPWDKGTMYEFLDLAIKLKPKVIIPVHDWMLTEDWKEEIYSRINDFLASNGVKFSPIANFDSLES